MPGRFLLRLDPGVHEALRVAASATGVSLNEYCVRKLAAPGLAPVAGAADVVTRAAATIGGDLIGVVVFGSWARGDATERSDVDVLVVVDRSVELKRDLYHRWDESPVFWEGRRVEPHFAHLPPEDRSPSALWLEVAVDGVVLFERGIELSRRLARLRSRIVEGRVRRRWSHGQPYWVEAA